MKIAIVLLALFGAAMAFPRSHNTGRSHVERKDDGHGNYEFAYDEEHHSGGTSRREKGGKGWQTGSYELRDKDGRKRTVKYVADSHGFRAKVDTNEPGTADEDPADVDLDSRNHGTNHAWSSHNDGHYNNYDDGRYNNNNNNGWDNHNDGRWNDDYGHSSHGRSSGYGAHISHNSYGKHY